MTSDDLSRTVCSFPTCLEPWSSVCVWGAGGGWGWLRRKRHAALDLAEVCAGQRPVQMAQSVQVQEAGQNEGHEISASAVLDGPCCSQRARDTCVSNSPNELPLECKVYRQLSTVIKLPENLQEGWC